MTTLDSARTRARGPHLRTIGATLLASLITLGLGGCESASNMLSGGGSTAPQASLSQPAPSPVSNQTAKFQIAPVIGSPENVAHNLQTELAAAIGRNGATVATSTASTGEYVIRGYIVAAREGTKAKISYIWDVTDQTGKRVHRITGEEVAAGAGKDPWAAVNPQLVQRIADNTAKQIASWLPSSTGVVASTTGAVNATASTSATPKNQQYAMASNATPQQIAPTTGSIATSGPITAVVPMVTGAPGDGGSSLTSAITRELSKNGLSVATTPGGQAYKVEGKVAMGESKDGKQPIQIDWNVLDPNGKKLGTVSQKNEVPQGSLDGSWGKTADAAAAAAAQGIIKLLPQKSIN